MSFVNDPHELKGKRALITGGSLTIPDSEWLTCLETNFLSAVRLTSALLPGMLERGSGSIVNISSVAALVPHEPLLHYSAAKAALISYGKGLATEMAPRGVRVNTVTPGNVVTPGADAVREEFTKAYGVTAEILSSAIPLRRMGLPEDIAEIVGFLVSDRAAWITGSNSLSMGANTRAPSGQRIEWRAYANDLRATASYFGPDP